jgi:anti-sigma factor RsiW
MRVWCVAARTGLALTEPGATLPQPMERHLATCLRCQAERARQRRLQRQLAELRHKVAAAPSVHRLPDGGGRWFGLSPGRIQRRSRPDTGALAGVGALVAGGAAYVAWRILRRPA